MVLVVGCRVHTTTMLLPRRRVSVTTLCRPDDTCVGLECFGCGVCRVDGEGCVGCRVWGV